MVYVVVIDAVGGEVVVVVLNQKGVSRSVSGMDSGGSWNCDEW